MIPLPYGFLREQVPALDFGALTHTSLEERHKIQ
jgi:hypothetical protein